MDWSRRLLLVLLIGSGLWFIACGGGGVPTSSDTSPSASRDTSLPPSSDASSDASHPETPATQPPPSPDPEVDFGSEFRAYAAAENLVRQHLKWPDDASFSWGKEAMLVDSEVGGKDWIVKGKVKAANAMGAKLTYNYAVRMQYQGNGEWKAWKVMVGDEIGWTNPDYEQKVQEFAQQRQREDAARKQAFEESLRWRTWTSSDGQHTTRAKLVRLDREQGQVVLEKEDGSTAELPLDKLSENDRAYVHEELNLTAVEIKKLPRIWTDLNGKTIEATFAGIVDGKVILKTKDGRRITLTPNQLSEPDRKFLDAE